MSYILLGPEEGDKNEWIKKKKAQILKEHPDAEIYTFFAGDDNGAAVNAVLAQSSLFSSYRLAIIKMFENRTKTDGIADAVISFLKSGQKDADLIIVTSEKSDAKIPEQIKKLIPKENRIFFWEMFENKKREWIVKAFRDEGFGISDDAIDEILFSVENNTQEMKNLVSSLTLYFRAAIPDKKSISAEDISEYAIKTRTEDGTTLFQAIAERDLEHAILIMKTISESDPMGLQKAFQTVGTRFRLLESFMGNIEKGMSVQDAASSATYLSPYPENFTQSGIRKKEIPVFSKAMSGYKVSDVRAIISYIGRMDTDMKSAGSDIAITLFSDVLYTIIAFRGRENKLSLTPPDLDIRI